MHCTPGSACPQPEPNAIELPSSAPGRPKLIELQATKPSPTPTRTEENIATTPGCGPAGYSGHRAFAHADTYRGTHRRWVVDLQAAAPSPTPTRRTPRRAADRAPPRPHQPAHTLAHRRAPKITSHVVGLQTSPRFAPLHTPTRTEENFATRPPFDHSDARGGITCCDAGLQTSRPRRPLRQNSIRRNTRGNLGSLKF